MTLVTLRIKLNIVHVAVKNFFLDGKNLPEVPNLPYMEIRFRHSSDNKIFPQQPHKLLMYAGTYLFFFFKVFLKSGNGLPIKIPQNQESTFQPFFRTQREQRLFPYSEYQAMNPKQ